MQIYADVLGREIRVAAAAPSPALGGALYAAAAAGCHGDLAAAVRAMVNTELTVYRPNAENTAAYRRLYGLYCRLHEHFGRRMPELMAELKEG